MKADARVSAVKADEFEQIIVFSVVSHKPFTAPDNMQGTLRIELHNKKYFKSFDLGDAYELVLTKKEK